MWVLAVLALFDSSRTFSVVVPPAESLRVTVSGPETSVPVVLIPGLSGRRSRIAT